MVGSRIRPFAIQWWFVEEICVFFFIGYVFLQVACGERNIHALVGRLFRVPILFL